MFDPELFTGTAVEGEMSTEFTPIPEGEFNAIVSGVKAREAKGHVMLDVSWDIDDAAVAEATQRDKNTARQTLFLDMTESGGMDMGKGKNIQLGKLREALGQNGPGAWSPSMLEGKVAKVKIAHRMYEGQIFSDVKGVSAVS